MPFKHLAFLLETSWEKVIFFLNAQYLIKCLYGLCLDGLAPEPIMPASRSFGDRDNCLNKIVE